MFQAMEALGYRFQGGKEERLLGFEWNQKDVVGVNGVGTNWDRACWRGRYRYDVVCDVENRFAEFELTMRGMFDLRTRLSVGVFFADHPDPDIGEGTWNAKSKERRSMSSWAPPPGGTEDFPWRFAEGDEVLVLLLSNQRPEVLTVRSWRCHDGSWR